MTAIPAATEEDFEGIRNIEEIYAETEEILKGYGLMDCNDKIAIESVLELSYLRIISHYQRENERLERELNDSQSELLSTINVLTDTRLFAAEKAAEWKSLIADLTAENEEMRSVINAQKGD